MIYEIIYFYIWDSSAYIFKYSAIYALTMYSLIFIHIKYIFNNKTETIQHYRALLKHFFLFINMDLHTKLNVSKIHFQYAYTVKKKNSKKTGSRTSFKL